MWVVLCIKAATEGLVTLYLFAGTISQVRGKILYLKSKKQYFYGTTVTFAMRGQVCSANNILAFGWGFTL